MSARDGSSNSYPSTVNIAPPSGKPNNQIGWRPLIVNWFGSLFFIGLLAPMIVWSVVYCIRTRRPNKLVKRGKDEKKSRGRARSKKSVTSWPKPDSATKIANEIEPYHGWNAMAADLKAPKARMSKRDHFARYLGWWSTSIDDHGRLKDIGGPDDPVIFPRPWPLLQLHQISKENLAEPGQVGTALQSIEEEKVSPTKTPQSLGTGVQQTSPNATSTGLSRENEEYLMSGALGSEGASENNTVRRRAVCKDQINIWAELTSQLSNAATKRLLISDHQPPEAPESLDRGKAESKAQEADFRVHEKETTLAITPPSKDSNESPGMGLTVPKLRKVHSSPTLNATFKAPVASYFTKLPHKPLARNICTSLPLDPPCDQFDGTSDSRNVEDRGAPKTRSGLTAVSSSCLPTAGRAIPEDLSRRNSAEKVPAPTQRSLPASVTLTVTKHRNRRKQHDPETGVRPLSPPQKQDRAFSFDVRKASSLNVPGWVARKLQARRTVEVDLEKGETSTLAGYERPDDAVDSKVPQRDGSGSSAYTVSEMRLSSFQHCGRMEDTATTSGTSDFRSRRGDPSTVKKSMSGSESFELQLRVTSKREET